MEQVALLSGFVYLISTLPVKIISSNLIFMCCLSLKLGGKLHDLLFVPRNTCPHIFNIYLENLSKFSAAIMNPEQIIINHIGLHRSV